MKGSDICRIIKACKDSGVKHFVFGDLEFVFGDTQEPFRTATTYQQEKSLEIGKDLTDNDHDSAEQDILEDHLANLALTDPSAFEEVALKSELNG